MTDKHLFADVDLPFHFWVREGHRWVLRDAASRLQGEGVGAPVPTPSVTQDRPDPPGRPA